MPKLPNKACGDAPGFASYPGSIAIPCLDSCWPPGFYPVDVWDNCEVGSGVCVWTVYLLWCEFVPPSSRICWYGYTLRYSDCVDVPPSEANYTDDLPRKILYEYNIVGHPAFWKGFVCAADGQAVFRYCNNDTPCNVKVKIDPEYFLP